MPEDILAATGIPVIDVALNTLSMKKQALVFVNARNSAEKTAEDIAKKLPADSGCAVLAEKILKAVGTPTKQCRRLATAVEKGIAFHHSGLTQKQKELVEHAFKEGMLRIIACTPTLAAGVDLPAFRAIIRDVKRFGARGMAPIPVLEYLQMCGRAGRPSYDVEGQAILLPSSSLEAQQLTEQYIRGVPEPIQSKLAVEPVLRAVVLSLIATRSVRTKQSLVAFFSKTLWSHQYGDASALLGVLEKVLAQLASWRFLKPNEEFSSAHDMQDMQLTATFLGKRVAELYLDPLTAHQLAEGLEKATQANATLPAAFPTLHLLTFTLEMRPYLRTRLHEETDIEETIELSAKESLVPSLSPFEEAYEDFLGSAKTALLLEEWIDEKNEDYLLEKFAVRPGELRAKLSTCDWLIYSCIELCTLLDYKQVRTMLAKLRWRLKYGAKEELLPLLRLKYVGRVRARKLFNNNIKNIGDIRKAEYEQLAKVIGSRQVARSLQEQTGTANQQQKQGDIGNFL